MKEKLYLSIKDKDTFKRVGKIVESFIPLNTHYEHNLLGLGLKVSTFGLENKPKILRYDILL